MNETLAPRPRRLRMRHVIVAAVGASVVAMVATYLVFFSGSSPSKFKLSTPAADPTTSAVAAGSATTAVAATAAPSSPAANVSVAGEWAVGSGSAAGYRVREKLARLPAQSDAVGRTTAVNGTIAVTAQGSQVVVAGGAKFDVDVSKLASNESMRDNRIRTMGLESNRFPTATFVSASPIQVAAPGSGQSVHTEVTGDLTIHGVTRRVTIPLDTQLVGGRIEVVGSLSFPFSEFGMTAPSIGGFVTVTDTATLEFQLFFDRR